MTISLGDTRKSLAVIALGILIAGARGIPVLRAELAARAANVATLRDRVAFTRDARRLLPALRDSLVARRARLVATNAQSIAAPAAPAAASLLGALVERIADDANVSVSTLELRADTTARASTTHLTVRLIADGDVIGLETFLRAVDQRDEAMFVSRLTVTQSDPASADDRAELLHFDMTITCLALVRGEGR